MVYAAVNGHLQVVSALLDTFFPALPQEAEAARAEGKHAEATFLATPGSRDSRIAQLVGSRDMSASAYISCHAKAVPRLEYLPKQSQYLLPCRSLRQLMSSRLRPSAS